MSQAEKDVLERERWQILVQFEEWLELPMIVLGFVWLALLVAEFVWGLTPLLERLGLVIWIIFILEFLLRFSLAPRKLSFLRGAWLTLVALMIPALRVFRVAQVVRVLRAARAVRGLRLVRVVTSLNRGMRSLGATMGRRGFGYVVALTLVVTVAGAAGMYVFERDPGLDDYSAALWWTAMIMTTLGSEFWPETAEGRILGLLLSIYAVAVFGYITASLASFFVGRDAELEEGEVAGSREIVALREEIRALREELRAAAQRSGEG